MRPLVEAIFRATRNGSSMPSVRVRVEEPRRAKTGEWTCRVLATGVAKPTVVHGEDGLQALCLALDLLGDQLYKARRRGVRLRHVTGDADVPLFAYFRLREWRRRLRRYGALKSRR